MQPRVLRSAAVVTITALAAAGCENLTPGQNAAAFGGGAAILAGSLARAAGMSGAESLAVGVAAGAVVAATAYVISKHQASERQRKIAEERARVAYVHIAARHRSHERSVAQKSTGSGGAKSTAGAAKPLPRYIAVDTVKDEHTAPQAQKSVMIWDTEKHEVVGNNVYDVSKTPSVGSTAKFDNYTAEYVGSGS